MQTPSADATARLQDGRLVLVGALVRSAVPTLWAAVTGLKANAIDVGGVTRVDSAGLALLGELSARSPDAVIHGNPPGLADLRAAYRLDDRFGLTA